MPETSDSGDIVKFSRLYEIPTPDQIKNKLDMNNYPATAGGSQEIIANTYSKLEMTDLQPGVIYAFFIIVESEMSGYPIYTNKDDTLQFVIKTLSKIEILNFRCRWRSFF